MLPIHDLEDAIFTESMSTLGNIGVIERLEADDTFSVLAYDPVYTDSNGFVKPGLLFLETGRVLR